MALPSWLRGNARRSRFQLVFAESNRNRVHVRCLYIHLDCGGSTNSVHTASGASLSAMDGWVGHIRPHEYPAAFSPGIYRLSGTSKTWNIREPGCCRSRRCGCNGLDRRDDRCFPRYWPGVPVRLCPDGDFPSRSAFLRLPPCRFPTWKGTPFGAGQSSWAYSLPLRPWRYTYCFRSGPFRIQPCGVWLRPDFWRLFRWSFTKCLRRVGKTSGPHSSAYFLATRQTAGQSSFEAVGAGGSYNCLKKTCGESFPDLAADVAKPAG